MSIADEIYDSPSKDSWNQSVRPGLVLAEVVNIKDPDNLGRIKVRGLTEEKANEDDWCYMMTPFAGKQHGIQFMPDVGDLVVLAYINGDIQSPVILGCLWNNKIKMPYPLKDGKNFSFTLKTPAGHEIVMEGEKGKEKVTVKTPAGTMLMMDDEKKAISLQDKNKKNAVLMDLQKGEMQLLADKKITIKTGQASLLLESSGKATLKSSNSILMDGAKIEVKAKSALKQSGTQVEVKANGQLNLQSSGITNVKGSMLNLN